MRHAFNINEIPNPNCDEDQLSYLKSNPNPDGFERSGHVRSLNSNMSWLLLKLIFRTSLDLGQPGFCITGEFCNGGNGLNMR